MNRKVCHLTSAHTRHDTRIFKKMCVSLSRSKYQTILIVADGEGDEFVSGVNILDVGAKGSSRIKRMTITVFRVYTKAKSINADVYHFHDPELIPVGLLLKQSGYKVIFDIHEMTRLQILTKKWLPSFLRGGCSRSYALFEDYSCRKFDFLITPQEEMTNHFNQYTETETVFNYPEYSYTLEKTNASRFNLIYAGAISEERGLDNYIALIERLVSFDDRYCLILACPESDSLRKKIKSSTASENIDLVGYVTFDRLVQLYSISTFGLILFNNVGQYYMANALKLFEYMGGGLLVIMPNFGEWPAFNDIHRVGVNVDTSDAESIAEIIYELRDADLNSTSSKNIELVQTKFSWSSQELRLLNIYKKVLDE